MRIRIKVVGALFPASLSPTLIGGEYEFVYDPACTEYDWVIVFDELPEKSMVFRCPRERTILCTWEPVSVKGYSRAYTRQFGHLLTNRPPEAERHPHYHLGRGYFLWFVRNFPKHGEMLEKPKVLSAVCSSKQMKHTAHHDRFRLIGELAKAIPGMDWFGKGVRPLERKEDALLPYRYHIAVENHIGVHHWTEKFADAILCECLPFYAGDPALAEIFPADCFIPIPIGDPGEAIRIVKAAIAGDEYSRRRPAILEAKRLILSKYNFWQQVVEVVESASSCPGSAVRGGSSVFYARRELRKHSLAAAFEDCWVHLLRFWNGRTSRKPLDRRFT